MEGPPPTNPSSWRRLAVLLLLGGALILTVQLFANSRDRVSWGEAVPAARTASAGSGRPVLMFFSADWCPSCHALKSAVFSDAKVADRIDTGFEAVRVDLTDPKSPDAVWAQQYGVMAIPAVVATDADGRELARLEGAVSAEQFSGWLDGVTASPALGTAQRP